MAWLSTEAVRTQSRELVLGRSLSEFMRSLGINSDSSGVRGEQTRLRNQMNRLFGCTVSLGIIKLTHHKLRQPQDIVSRATPEYSMGRLAARQPVNLTMPPGPLLEVSDLFWERVSSHVSLIRQFRIRHRFAFGLGRNAVTSPSQFPHAAVITGA